MNKMNNREYYRAAFSRVKAPEDAVEKALERQRGKKRRVPRFVPVAAALILLTSTAYAELDNGSVSNLLAPLFGYAQTELVDSIGYPINASASVSGYTITADAVIGDRYNMYVVLTLSRNDGEPVPENVSFPDSYNSAQGGTGGGYTEWKQNEDGSVNIIESWSSKAPLHLGRNVTMTFPNLMKWHEETDDYTIEAEGPWILRFALRYQDTTKKIPVNDLTVTDEKGNQYEIQKVLLSVLSCRVNMIGPRNMFFSTSEDAGESPTISSFKAGIAIRLKDGTIEPITNSNSSGSGTEGEQTVKAQYTGHFDVPHPLEEIKAIIICDKEIPVN